MKEMIIVYNSTGYAIGIVDAVQGIEDKVKAALENWLKIEIPQMPSCFVYPGVQENKMVVPMANGTSVKITLKRVRYYQ
jgi:hypothetical protein